MLTQLHIRDFAIVRELQLEFEEGFSVLTGETGAGKSILIEALSLALGSRAESGVIRHGAKRAEVTASFAIPPKHGASAWLKENDLWEDGGCVLRRVVEADKPSKGYLNGRPVPIQQLRELSDLLLDIHGQHEHQSLLKRDAQRQTLDDYAEITDKVATLAERYSQLHAVAERLETLKRESADRDARLDLLRYQVHELDALKLTAEEIPSLESEHQKLAHGAQLIEGVQAVAQSVYDDDESAARALLSRAAGKLEELAQYDHKLNDAVTLLNDATIQTEEAASRLHQYLDNLELDPQRLTFVEERIGALHTLSRKHRVKPEELPALAEKLKTELADLDNIDSNLEKLESELKTLRVQYLNDAQAISKVRTQASGKLSKAVTQHMQELGMPGGKFEVALTALPEGELTAYGLERTEFLVSANPGQPVKPLTKVASGGELSRISLSLQVVLAALGRIPTLIFDEVDVGVGGRVAEIVGQTLRALGKSRQVLCVTHLAQVAALGHHHFVVTKQTEKNSTSTGIETVTGAARVQELARMIGGVTISRETLAHAKDMLDRATN
jgi:DNA repair protein RecN (Recombination protein N)